MAPRDTYNMYADVMKVVGTHPCAGVNVRVVGEGESGWLVEKLDLSARLELGGLELKYVTHEWRDAALKYEPVRIMTYFDGPGDVEKWPRFSANCHFQGSPPNCHDTLAFWGNQTFTYSFNASRSHYYSRETGANNWFWHQNSRIFGGVVWSNCGPWMDRQHINSEFALAAPPYSFQWWPCIYSIAPDGLVYVKCQDFVFTKGRPRLCDTSRLVPFMQLAGPIPLTPLPEEVSEDDVSSSDEDEEDPDSEPQTELVISPVLNLSLISQMRPSKPSGFGPDDDSDTASTRSTIASSSGTSMTSWSSSTSSSSALTVTSSSAAASWVDPTISSASSWADPTSSEVDLSDYEVFEF